MQFLKKLFLLNLISFIFVSFSISGCYSIYSQDPEDLFVDEELPFVLKELANPPLTGVQSVAILARWDEKRVAPRLRVAVIDNGVDYLHPTLIYQTNFQIKNRKIVGAGIDMMGKDSWPHPNLIDPSLFAFGAEGINERGQIIDPVENPLLLYHCMNQKFMAELTLAIQKHPTLRYSLFTKINSSSFTLTAAQVILSMPHDEWGKYEKNKELGLVFDWNARANKSLKAGVNDDIFEMSVKRVLDFDWVMQEVSGNPIITSLYGGNSFTLKERIDGGDKFYELLRQVYESFSLREGYEKAYEPYFEFCYNRFDKKSLYKRSELIRDFSGKLHHSWFKVVSDFRAFDPLANLSSRFKDSLTLEEYEAFYEMGLSDKEKEAFARGRYKGSFQKVKQLQEYRLEHDHRLNASEKSKIAKSLERIDKLEDRFFSYMNKRGWEKLYGSWGEIYPLFEDSLGQGIRNDSWITANPYLDITSHSRSHGTHVASVIAASDSRVDIEPVRIVTNSKKNSDGSRRALIDDFSQKFENWLKSPLVSTAIYNKFLLSFENVKNLEATREEKNQSLRNAITALARKTTEENFSSIALDLEFFLQLDEAIKYVGEHKVKLANISLGANFSKADPLINMNDREKVQKNIVNFLRYEYFKNRIALSIKNNAPHTLFFVAAGNNGSWFDSRERSGLPADISSPFLMDAEGEVGGKAVNNNLDNIIAVISLKRGTEHLSSFTNIPLSDVPTIMAVGDPVVGSIKLTDSGGAREEYSKLFNDSLEVVNVDMNSEFDRDTMVQLGWLSTLSVDEKIQREEARKIIHQIDRYYNMSLYDISSTLQNEFFVQSSIAHQNYRGTSMASPNAAGVAAKLILDKMTEMGLRDKDIYEHAEFAPKKIIDMLYARSESYGGHSLIRNAQKLKGAPHYKEIPKIPTGQDTEYVDYVKSLMGVDKMTMPLKPTE